MRKRRKIVVVSLLVLLISVMVVSVIYFFGSPPLNFSAQLEKIIFEKGTPIRIDVLLKNVGLWSVTIEDVGFYLRVEDEMGEFIWSVFLSDIYGLMNQTTLNQGEEIRQFYEWSQIGKGFADGQYEVSTGIYQFEAYVSFNYMNRFYQWKKSSARIEIVQ